MSSSHLGEIWSACAWPKMSGAYVRETGWRHEENVSAWGNNEGTPTKQSKITLTSLFITCVCSDIHTNCCRVSVSSFTLQHPSCPKWFITLHILHILGFLPSLSGNLKHYFRPDYITGEDIYSILHSHTDTWDVSLKSSSNQFKYKHIEMRCCVIHRHPLGGLVAKRGSHV